MKNNRLIAIGAIAALLVSALGLVMMSEDVAAFGAGASTGEGDLDRIRDQDRTCSDAACDQAQVRDCDQTMDQLSQDDGCDQTCDRDRITAQDGSCQDATYDHDGTGDRDRDRACR